MKPYNHKSKTFLDAVAVTHKDMLNAYKVMLDEILTHGITNEGRIDVAYILTSLNTSIFDPIDDRALASVFTFALRYSGEDDSLTFNLSTLLVRLMEAFKEESKELVIAMSSITKNIALLPTNATLSTLCEFIETQLKTDVRQHILKSTMLFLTRQLVPVPIPPRSNVTKNVESTHVKPYSHELPEFSDAIGITFDELANVIEKSLDLVKTKYESPDNSTFEKLIASFGNEELQDVDDRIIAGVLTQLLSMQALSTNIDVLVVSTFLAVTLVEQLKEVGYDVASTLATIAIETKDCKKLSESCEVIEKLIKQGHRKNAIIWIGLLLFKLKVEYSNSDESNTIKH